MLFLHIREPYHSAFARFVKLKFCKVVKFEKFSANTVARFSRSLTELQDQQVSASTFVTLRQASVTYLLYLTFWFTRQASSRSTSALVISPTALIVISHAHILTPHTHSSHHLQLCLSSNLSLAIRLCSDDIRRHSLSLFFSLKKIEGLLSSSLWRKMFLYYIIEL